MFIPSKENEAKNNHLSLGRCPHQTSLLMSTFLPRSVSSPNVCGFLDIVKISPLVGVLTEHLYCTFLVIFYETGTCQEVNLNPKDWTEKLEDRHDIKNEPSELLIRIAPLVGVLTEHLC
jgi:hypothetical protein